jgi:hypothetical protein
MTWLREQQDMGIADRRQGRGREKTNEPGVGMPDDFEPLDAAPGGLAVESLTSRIDPDRLSRLTAFASNCPAAGRLPLSQLDEILQGAGVDLGREVTGVR